MGVIRKLVDKEFIVSTLREDRTLISAIITDLRDKGKEIAEKMPFQSYAAKEDFFNALARGKSELNDIDGKVEYFENILILRHCVLGGLRKSLLDNNGKLPLFYDNIEQKYIQMYRRKTGILNPLCIVCQIVRETTASHIKVNGSSLRIVHLAAKSELTGKRVYSEEGLSFGSNLKLSDGNYIDKKKADELLERNACISLMIS